MKGPLPLELCDTADRVAVSSIIALGEESKNHFVVYLCIPIKEGYCVFLLCTHLDLFYNAKTSRQFFIYFLFREVIAVSGFIEFSLLFDGKNTVFYNSILSITKLRPD